MSSTRELSEEDRKHIERETFRLIEEYAIYASGGTQSEKHRRSRYLERKEKASKFSYDELLDWERSKKKREKDAVGGTLALGLIAAMVIMGIVYMIGGWIGIVEPRVSCPKYSEYLDGC